MKQFGNDDAEMLVRRISIPAVSGNPTVVASLANPFGMDVIITKAVLDSTVVAGAACTLDIGIAADGTTSNDTIMDGLDVNAATGLFDNVTNKGTNGKPQVVWGAAQFLNVCKASGNANALVAALFVEAVPRI